MPASSTNSTTRLEHCAWFVVFPSLFLANARSCVKPWPNGLASRGKLKTWVYLQLCFVRSDTYADLQRLALPSKIKFAHKVCKVFTVCPLDQSWVASIRSFMLITQESSLPCNGVFVWLACTCDKTCDYIWSSTQVSTQVQLTCTWESVWPGLNDSNLVEWLQNWSSRGHFCFIS